MTDVALNAMNAIKEIIDADSELSAAVRLVHVGLKDLSDYRDRLPAIGIAYTNVRNEDDGKVTVAGFCEVVASGERGAAGTASRQIGSTLWDILRYYSTIGAITEPIQGVSTSGFQAIDGEIGSRWVSLVHVFWTVEI